MTPEEVAARLDAIERELVKLLGKVREIRLDLTLGSSVD